MDKKWLVAVPMALILMASTALYVRAAEGDGILPCADIVDGLAIYSAPSTEEGVLGEHGWTTPGSLDFQISLAGTSCQDVQYGIAVLEADPLGGTPVVLGTSSVPGDGVSNKVGFSLEISEVSGESVCVYTYAMGSSGESSSGKTGAAFDGTSSSTVLDRAPDGPLADGKYCIQEVSGGSGGSSGYN